MTMPGRPKWHQVTFHSYEMLFNSMIRLAYNNTDCLPPKEKNAFADDLDHPHFETRSIIRRECDFINCEAYYEANLRPCLGDRPPSLQALCLGMQAPGCLSRAVHNPRCS